MTGLLGDMWDGVSNFLGKPKIATPKRIEPKEDDPYGLMAMVANAGQDSEVFRKNIIPNTVDIGKGLLQIARDPMTAAKDATNVTMGAIGNVLPEGVNIGGGLFDYDNTENVKNVSNMFDTVVDKLSTAEGRRDTFLQNPVDFLFGAFALASGATKLSKMTPDIKDKFDSVVEKVELQVSKGMDQTEAFAVEVDKLFPDAFGGVPMQKIITNSGDYEGLGVSQGIIDNIKLLDPTYANPAKRVGDLRMIKEGTYDPNKTVQTYGKTVGDEPVSLYDYMNRYIVFGMGDTSSTTGEILNVNGFPLHTGVKKEGGTAFGTDAANYNRKAIWASAKTQLTALQNKLREVQNASRNTDGGVLFANWQMKGSGIDFSHQMANSMLQAVKGNLDKIDMKELDRLIKETSTKVVSTGEGKNKVSKTVNINQDWRGVNSKNPLKGLDGDDRKAIIKLIDVNFREGVGSRTDHRLANSDPNQLITEPTSLHMLYEPDLSKSIKKSPHSTYPYEMEGKPEGRILEQVSHLDLAEVINKGEGKNAGKRITGDSLQLPGGHHGYRSMSGQLPAVKLTKGILDEAVEVGRKRFEARQGLLL